MNGRRALLALALVLLAAGGLGWWATAPVESPASTPPAETERADPPPAPHADDDAGRARVTTTTPTTTNATRVRGVRALVITVVTAYDDEPVAGARARLLRAVGDDESIPDPGSARLVVLDEKVTAPDGTIVFEQRGHWVRVEADGYAPVVVPHDDAHDEIRLFPLAERSILVVDENDDPVSTAQARIYSERHCVPVAVVSADDAGRLEFQAGDDQEVAISAPGYATTWIEQLGEWGDADVVLHPGAAIEGVVVTSDGEPVADVSVSLDLDGVPSQTTGADGRFRFDALRRSAVAHEVSVESRDGLHAEAGARTGARDVRLVLEDVAVVSGRVFESDGSPAGDVRIELPDRGVCTTPIDGCFTAGVPAGPVRIVARMLRDTGPPGGHPDTRGEVGFVDLEPMPDEQITGVEIHMEAVPASYVYFAVQGPDGARIRGHGLTYDDAHDRGFQRHHGTHAEGEWWKLGVPAGTPVKLSFTTARDDDIADSFEATVRTRAQPEGAPDIVRAPHVSDGTIELTLTTVRTDGAAIPEDADVNWMVGRQNPARATGLPPGSPPTGVVRIPRGESATVLAWADGCGTLEFDLPIVDEERQSFTCRLPPESIVSGHLVTRTGRPVTRAHVEVLVTEPGGAESLSVASYDQLLPDGAFEAGQLGGGAGRVTVWDSDRRIIAERTFEVPESARVELGDVVVGALPIARGTVTIHGRPASGVGVTAGDGQRFASTSTGPDGAFELPVPRRAGAALALEADGLRVLYYLDDVLDGSPVRLRADATGELRVTFDERKRDVESVAVRLPGGTRAMARTALLLDRHLSLGGLPAGPVEIAITTDASAGGLRIWRGTADVVAGETTDVTLTLER